MSITPYLDNLRWEGVKNTSGDTCPAFGLLAVTGTEMRGDTYTRPIILGLKPSTTFYREYVVNGPTAIPAGKYGRCTRMSGAILIAYDSGTPANGEGWGPKPGQYTASKGFPGITVEGIHNSTKKRLLGTLAPIGTLLGQTAAAITGGTVTSGTASTSYKIFTGVLDAEADGGWTTVPVALSRTDIAITKFIKLTFMNNGWEIEPLEC